MESQQENRRSGAPATLGDSLRDRRAHRFVGRSGELATLAAWLGPAGGSTPVLNLTGPGGIGKSWLLSRFAGEAAAAGRPVVVVDGRQVGGDPDTLYSLVGGAAGRAVAQPRLQADGLLLMIDTYGAMEMLSDHVLDLVSALPPTARVLIAGRTPLAGTWTAWSGSIRHLPLRALTLPEQLEYLQRRAITDRLTQSYLTGLSAGHPLTLSLASDLVELGQDPAGAPEWGDLVGQLATQVRAGLPPAARSVIEAAAVLGRFNEEDLAAVSGRLDAGAALGELSGLSLLRISGDRFELHDEVRRALIEDLRANRPARLAVLRRRALRHYRTVAKLESLPDRSLVLERIRMVGRDMFELSAWYGSEVDADIVVHEATPAALDDLLRLQAAGLLPRVQPPLEERSPELLAKLVEHPAANVRIAVSKSTGEIHAYGFWLAVDEETIQLFEPEGPVFEALRRSLQKLGRSRPPAGGSHLYYLSSVAFLPSDIPAFQAMGLDLLTLFTTEGAYVSLTSDPIYAQGMTGAGSRPLGPPLPGPAGEADLQPYLLDVASTGFEGWIQALGTGEDPPRLPSGDALIELVRTAVAAWDDDRVLAGTVLADVAEGDSEASDAERADVARQFLIRSLTAGRPWPTPEALLSDGLAAAGITALPGQRGGTEAPPEGSPAGRSSVGPAGNRPAHEVSVCLLGRCEITTSDGATVDFPPGIAGHALKYVALKGKVPVEELVEELWPEAPPGAGRSRLRTVMTRLRQAVGPLVVRSGDWMALAPGVSVDVDRFVEACAAAQACASEQPGRAAELARAAVGIYQGELLPADRHLAFTVGPRERMRRRFVSSAQLAVSAAGEAGDIEAAVHLLEDTIAVDPFDESLYLRAAELLIEAGRTAEAARYLQRARAALEELGLGLSAASDPIRDRLGL